VVATRIGFSESARRALDYQTKPQKLVIGSDRFGSTSDAHIFIIYDEYAAKTANLDGSKNLVDWQHFRFHRLGGFGAKACGGSKGLPISMVG
jgi:hypothetical protein